MLTFHRYNTPLPPNHLSTLPHPPNFVCTDLLLRDDWHARNIYLDCIGFKSYLKPKCV